MKKKKNRVIKSIAAVLAALVVLDLFCIWYYNPAKYEWDEYRATDNVRTANRFTSRASEGIAYSVTDAYGYNNAEIPGEDGVSVLMMGSSHLEGYNVMPEENVAVLLSEMLKEEGYDGFIYNIGTSAHNFTRNVANLERALERFAPKDYLIMETASIMITEADINAALNDSYNRNTYTKTYGVEWLTSRPLFAAVYKQWQALNQIPTGEEIQEFVITDEVVEAYRVLITELIRKIADAAEEYGVKPIIYYHPHLVPQADGTAIADVGDVRCLNAFREVCENAGVGFVDMTDEFMRNYAENHILPHGFINSAPGEGHLNAEGNAMIAQALCAAVLGGEDAA